MNDADGLICRGGAIIQRNLYRKLAVCLSLLCHALAISVHTSASPLHLLLPLRTSADPERALTLYLSILWACPIWMNASVRFWWMFQMRGGWRRGHPSSVVSAMGQLLVCVLLSSENFM